MNEKIVIIELIMAKMTFVLRIVSRREVDDEVDEVMMRKILGV
jgi:hypothetical protein